MFCQKCGLRIEDNSKFCTGCGTPTENVAQPTKANKDLTASAPYRQTACAVKTKKMPKWAWAAIAGVIAVVVIILCVVLINGNESKNVIGQWERVVSQDELEDWQPYEYDYLHTGWVFGEMVGTLDDGKMYGYAYRTYYDGSVERGANMYSYYLYRVNEDNTVTIIEYYYSFNDGMDVDVEDTLVIKIVNGKRALVSQEREGCVYYYSGNGNDVLDMYE